MIVITTPTGQIGRQVLGNLLDSGEQLRVIARDPSQLPAGVREDLDIVEGSHGDAAVADKAFAGADAVLWLTPADRRAPTVTVVRPRRPGRSWQRTAIIAYSPYRAALQRTLSVSITRSRCLRQSNPGLGPITLTTPQISIAMSVASMPGRIVPARRARSISSAMTAISSSCSAWRFRPRLPGTARQRVLNPGVPGGRLRDTAQQPLDQRERFSAGLERPARPPGEQAERLTDQLRQQRLLGREVPVDGAHADARVARDIVDLRIGAALREHRSRALQDPLAIAAGIGAQRALCFADSAGHGPLSSGWLDNRNHSSL